MPRFDSFSKGLALGIGVAILIPVAMTTLAPRVKPAARTAVKSGLRTVEKGREALAGTIEMVEDLVAETQAEMRAEREHAAADYEDETAEEAVPAEETEGTDQSGDETNVRSIVNE